MAEGLMGETFKGAAAGGCSSSSSSPSSILPFLPCMSISESGILQWASQISSALKSLGRGPAVSHVVDGETLGDFINDLREQSFLPALNSAALHGFLTYFNDLIPKAASQQFFENTLPCMADLALRLPSLLNDHFGNAKWTLTNAATNLRILHPQQAGLVFLSQELVAALLACAFFCLYPPTSRGKNNLPYFNFDKLYSGITSIIPSQEQKIHCILHYFTRVCKQMPRGVISYERKVLPRHTESGILSPISEPNENYWNTSQVPLCSIQVFEKGSIEDQTSDALEVDFANRYLGGGILSQGCVQEEIRFVISPELIAGMLFMSAMNDNESIEIRGTERFSSYDGYGSNFYFTGDYTDNKPRDFLGRRKTRIVAIDALVNPSKKQFRSTLMLRETNKAFCGFLDHAEHYTLDGLGDKEYPYWETSVPPNLAAKTGKDQFEGQQKAEWTNSVHDGGPLMVDEHVLAGESTLGIATGNWGCGAFGGDVELKSLLQWIAASQAGRPFLHYYSFGGSHGSKLQQLADWIINEKWCVGELWSVLVEYGQKRLNAGCCQGLFEWILPLASKDPPKSSLTDTTQQPV